MSTTRWEVFIWLLLSASLKHLTWAAPHVLPAAVVDAEEAAGMVEGDMLLTALQANALTNPWQRNGLVAETKRWPNRIVFYKIVGNFDSDHRSAILEAIETLEAHTCLHFREADATQPHYVAITDNPGGCYTGVGYQAKVQEMNLEIYPIGEGCFRPGTVLHEFMHALGFYHEHSATDRDDFIKVLYENIVPGKEFNFRKYSTALVTNFDVGYDYDSCMHYRPGAFSTNGEDTIVPLNPRARIGQRNGLSKMDVDKINVMYKCPIQI